MAINARELKAWADLFGIPGKTAGENDAEFRARLLRSVRKEPRVCIREEFEDCAAPGCISMYRVKKWTLHYNDGTKETLKTMYCQKPIGPKNTKFKGKVA